MINAAIEREKAERVVKSKTSDRPVFIVRYHSALPSVSKITKKHWRTMTLDPEMRDKFPKPPLVAYKRPQTIRNKLIRAKVPSKNMKPKRVINGNARRSAKYVPMSKLVKKFKQLTLIQQCTYRNCQTRNIYLIQCKKCRWAQYIGETKESL